MKAFKGLEKDLTCRGFQTVLLEQMIDDFNRYSKLVTFRYAQSKEAKCGERVFQWNLGKMSCIEEYMEELAKVMGVKLKYKFDVHVYGRGQKWEQELNYRAVEIVKEGKQVEAD